MANVKKCDRCGEIYSIINGGFYGRFTLFDADNNADPWQTGTYQGMRIGDMVDLCECCRDDLSRWYFNADKSNRGKANG